MIVGAKPSVNEEVIRYQARTKLATLATDIAAARKLISPETEKKRKKAKMIRLWLKALDYKAYLSREQREKIWYALIDIAEINDFPIAPLLEQRDLPNIITGGGTGPAGADGQDAGTTFNNSDVDTPSEIVDSFATSLANGCRWEYTIIDSTGLLLRKGSLMAGWTSGGTIEFGGEVTVEIGDTSAIVLSAQITSGSVELKATVASNNWIVKGKRYLD
jgi:hypothetical protein